LRSAKYGKTKNKKGTKAKRANAPTFHQLHFPIAATEEAQLDKPDCRGRSDGQQPPKSPPDGPLSKTIHVPYGQLYFR
jgi:hypothetical protein